MRTAITTLLALGVLAAPAAAQTPEPPVYTTTPMFFTCPGGPETKLLNNGGKWGLSATKPTASFTGGAGCGFYTNSAQGDAIAEGTFTGPVKNLSVEVHDLALSQFESNVYSPGSVHFTTTLSINGEPVVDNTGDDPPAESPVTVSSTGLSQSFKFGIDVSSLKLTDDVERTFRLTLGSFYIDSGHRAYVAGASEVPAGITFNTEKPTKPTVKP